MDDEIKESLESVSSELAYIGEKLTEISKYFKKMSNWSEEDEEKYGDRDEDEELNEDEDRVEE